MTSQSADFHTANDCRYCITLRSRLAPDRTIDVALELFVQQIHHSLFRHN